MSKRKIINIVFYVYKKNGKAQYESCIFYNDGTEKVTSLKEAIPECRNILQEKNITSVLTMEEMVKNSDGIFHVMTRNEFNKRHNEFVSKEILNEDLIEEFFVNQLDNMSNIEDEEMEDSDKIVITPPVATITPIISETIADENKGYEDEDEDTEEEIYEQPEDDKIIDFTTIPQRKKKKNNIFKEIKVRVTAFALATVLLLSGGTAFGCSKQKTKAGIPTNNTFFTSLQNKNKDEEKESKISKDVPTTATTTAATTRKKLIEEPANLLRSSVEEIGDNTKWDGKTYDELLDLTHNQSQKDAMTNIRKALLYFNDTFAKEYLEEGSNIRAALSFDEMLSLYVAFNDLDKDAIKAIFNGEEADSNKLGRNYRSAFLQLFGAYIISNSKTPVDLSPIIESEEGKQKYQKYNEMFYAIKDATAEEKPELVKKYYDELRKDYPLAEDIISEGIAHADDYNNVDGSMLPIMIITSALEAMEEAKVTDNTLSTIEIELTKDMAGCQIAYGAFDKAEIISLSTENDKTSPTLNQFRTAINLYLDENKINVPENEDDRDLSKLKGFKEMVNPEGYEEVFLEYHQRFIETVKEDKEIITWSETKTEVTKIVEEITEEEIPEAIKAIIDKKTAEENNKSKEAGNKEADKNQAERQKIEDENAEQIQQEIEASDNDLQEKNTTANETINNNNSDTNPNNDTRVNESDFGDHGVNFSDDHSNSNGDLNDSAKNITTDSTGDQTGTDLPSPEDTEEEFEERVEKREIPEQEESTQTTESEEEDEVEKTSTQTTESEEEDEVEETSTPTTEPEEHHEVEETSTPPSQPEVQNDEPAPETHHEVEETSTPPSQPEVQNDEPAPETHHEVVVDENSWYEYDDPAEESTEKVGKVDYERVVDEYLAFLDQQADEKQKTYVYTI